MVRDRELEDIIAKVDLFEGLGRSQLRQLANAAREVTHAAGHTVAAEGLGGMAFHYLLEGTASVTKDGRELRTLGPGDYFGEISMIDGKPRSATVTATTPITVLAIPHRDFEAVLDKDADFARALLRTLCARLREAEARSGG
jgi:CRP-like cAMP-binding protein